MDFKFPDVGEGIHEGKVVSWKVKEGDQVAADQVLAEVETDKAIVEIPSPQAGKVTKLHANEGDTINVGDVIVTFDGADQPAAASEPKPESAPEPKEEGRPPEQGTKKVESSLAPTAPKPGEHHPPAKPVEEAKDIQGPVTDQPGRVLATPATRKLAREKGVDIHTLTGTGDHGRITKDDVLAAAGGAPSQAPVQAAPTSQPTPESKEEVPRRSEKVVQKPAPASEEIHFGETIPYSGRRKAIGDHMTVANEIPAVTLFSDVDVTRIDEMRNHLKEKTEVKITYLSLFAKAVCSCLHKYPRLNSRLTEKGIEIPEDVHLGIAADTVKGLVVPVVRNANTKSVLELASEIADLADKARHNELKPDQIRGSTFTISSIGRHNVGGFSVMLNTPEAAILGIGGIKEKPWVHEGEIKIRKVITFSLTFDHRVLDGVECAKFLDTLTEMLEDPEMYILEGA